MSKQTINIALDIETLSTQPTAAIISIAAKCFSFEGDQPIDSYGNFFTLVNASTCAMYGLHVDMDTVGWWSKQSADAKRWHLECGGVSTSIKSALLSLRDYYDGLKDEFPNANILIWCQGTDFDIPIIRNAFHEVLGTDVPWPHSSVRDSRTFINGIVGLLYPDIEKPYSIIPDNPDWKKHDAISDCSQLIWNVRYVAKLINKTGGLSSGQL